MCHGLTHCGAMRHQFLAIRILSAPRTLIENQVGLAEFSLGGVKLRQQPVQTRIPRGPEKQLLDNGDSIGGQFCLLCGGQFPRFITPLFVDECDAFEKWENPFLGRIGTSRGAIAVNLQPA